MVEREQGRKSPDETVDAEDPVVEGDVTHSAGLVSGDEAKARSVAFFAALDKVMADHRNVLAALAK